MLIILQVCVGELGLSQSSFNFFFKELASTIILCWSCYTCRFLGYVMPFKYICQQSFTKYGGVNVCPHVKPLSTVHLKMQKSWPRDSESWGVIGWTTTVVLEHICFVVVHMDLLCFRWKQEEEFCDISKADYFSLPCTYVELCTRRQCRLLCMCQWASLGVSQGFTSSRKDLKHLPLEK